MRVEPGHAVRLEVEADCPKDFSRVASEVLQLSEADAYKVDVANHDAFGALVAMMRSRIKGSSAFNRRAIRPARR